MNVLAQRYFFAAGSLLLLVTVFIAAYFGEPVWIFAALAGGLVYLVQYPKTLFYLLLFSIPWSTEYNFPSGTGTDLPDEPLMLLQAAATIVMAIFYRKKIIAGATAHPLLILLLIQMMWLACTVLLSSYFILSAKFFLAKTWYLLSFVAAPLFLWQKEKVFKRSALILFISMLAVTGVTLLRHASLGFTFSNVNDSLEPFFRNHVNYSALLVFMIPFQILLLQLSQTKAIRRLLLISFLVTVPAIYLSFARGAWLALLIGLFSYWIIQKGWLVKTYVAVIVFVVALVFWLQNNHRYLQFAHDYQTTVFHHDLNEHLAATYQLKDVSTAERFHRWIAGVRMAEESWATGFGPATFYQHYKGYTVPAFKTWVSKNEEKSTVHNYFLLLLIEQGVVALLLFLCLTGAMFWYAQKIYHRTNNFFWKHTAAAIACVIAMQCTVNFLSDLIETDKVGSVFYMCGAALVIADIKTRRPKDKTLIGDN